MRLVFLLLLLSGISWCVNNTVSDAFSGLNQYFEQSTEDEQLIPMITNGEDANAQSYFVSLQEWNLRYMHKCGAVLISPRHILTAAHCFGDKRYFSEKDLKLYRVKIGYAGEYYDHGKGEELSRIIIHEDYSQALYSGVPSNDIALLVLKRRTSNIPAKLPTATFKDIDVEASVYGCGSTRAREAADFSRPTYPKVLQTTRLKLKPASTCNVYDHKAPAENICLHAVVLGSNICHGDSGGPVVVYKAGKSTVVGLNSWTHYGRCGKDNPAAATRVKDFLPWIYKKGGKLLKYYCKDVI